MAANKTAVWQGPVFFKSNFFQLSLVVGGYVWWFAILSQRPPRILQHFSGMYVLKIM